ncbi:MAG: hypothetical protein ACXWLM_10140 [Myxococcales bacterium]
MDPLLQTVTQSVAQDVRELVHAAQLEEQALVELDPPGFQWQWHLPLGFVSLAAAGTLLVAAGGVQWQVQEQRHGARKVHTHMHKKKVHVEPRPPLHS